MDASDTVDLRRRPPLGSLGAVAAVLAGAGEPSAPVDAGRTVDLVYTVDLNGRPERTEEASVERFWRLRLSEAVESRDLTDRPELIEGIGIVTRGDDIDRPFLRVAVNEDPRSVRESLRTTVNGVPVVYEERDAGEERLK